MKKPDRDINIFLTPSVNFGERMWEALPRREGNRSSKYRGSVYSLSIPSPSSPTIYAGIENHVLQVDFVSTDDVRTRKSDMHPGLYGEEARSAQQPILNLSCYERPSKGKETTDPLVFRKQGDLSLLLKYGTVGAERAAKDAGWDERLGVDTSPRLRNHRESSWRAQRSNQHRLRD